MNKLTARFFHTATLHRMAVLVSLLVGCLSAYAGDNKVWIESFAIVPGGEATVEVNLDNEDPVSSLQFDVYLPEGLTYVDNSIEKVASRITRSSHSLFGTTLTEYGKTFHRFGFLSQSATMATSAVKGNSGAVVTIKVKADPTFKSDKIVISNIVGSNATVAEPVILNMPEQEVPVMAQVATAGLANDEVKVRAGVPALIDVTLANDADIVGFQAKVTLPEGLSFTDGVDGEWVTYTDRLSNNVIATVAPLPGSENTYTVILSSLTNDVFEGKEGVLFSLNVVADNAFKGGEVRFTDIKVSTTYGLSYDMPDGLTALVTVNTDVTDDGNWDVDDIYEVIKVSRGESDNKYADVNGDGMVDIDDIYAAIAKVRGE